MTKKFDKVLIVILVVILFLASFIPRVIYISAGLPHHDAVQTAIATEKTLETGKLHGITENRYGYILINTIAYSIAKFIFAQESSELTINLVAILFASLSVVMMFFFVKELLLNKYLAFSSSLLFSFNPVYLSVTTYASSHAPSIFFILLWLYLFLKLIKTNFIIYESLFAIAFGFSLFIRFGDVIVTLPVLLLLASKLFNANEIKLKLNDAKSILTLWLPLTLILIIFFLVQKDALLNSISGNRFLAINKNLVLNTFFAIFLFMPILATFLSAYGLFFAFKEKRSIAFLLIIWFLSTFVFYSSFATAKLRFFVILFVPLSIFMGFAINCFRKKYSLLYPLLLISTLILMFILVQPFLEYKHNVSAEKESALFVATKTEPNALIFDAGDSGVFYDYYTTKGIISCVYAEEEKDFNEKISIINKALEENTPVYMSNQCFSLAKGEDAKFSKLWSTLKENYQFAEIGKIFKENPESVVFIEPKEYMLYKLRKKRT